MLVILKKKKFNDVLDEWLESQKYYVKESTYATYYNHVKNHIKPYFDGVSINEIKQNQLQIFINEKLTHGKLNSSQGLSVKTVKELVNVIRLCMSYAASQNYINEVNFHLKFPVQTKEYRLLSSDEYKIFVQYLKNQPTHFHVGILIFLCMGLRIGEICALKNSDIDLIHKEIHIHQTLQRIQNINDKHIHKTKIIITSTKTSHSTRTIPIPEVLMPYIHVKDNDYFFLTQSEKFIEPRAFRYMFKNILKKVQISEVTVHSLRHYFASNCIELGFDYNCLSEILGHSSPSTTMNLYVHCQDKHKQLCMNKIHI